MIDPNVLKFESRAGALPATAKATPFEWRDPTKIPPRAWVYGHHYIRKFVSATVAQAGLGKSTLALAEALAMATGRGLLGITVPRPLNVWYWCGEDPLEEIERRVHALCEFYKIKPTEFAGRLFADSGRTSDLKIAKEIRGETTMMAPATAAVLMTIIDNKIDVLQIDPFISSHSVDENSNTAIDAVTKQWAAIADATDCAIELIHHVRKPAQGQAELTVDDARGASALVATARSVRVLNRMSADEAKQASVDDRRTFFRADTGKANLAPPEAAVWFKLHPVILPNTDNVAVATSWTFPDIMDGVTVAHMHRVREIVRETDYRKDVRSPDWVGHVVAEVLDLDPDDDKTKIKGILKTWFANGVLRTETRTDPKTRKGKEFVTAGNWNETP